MASELANPHSFAAFTSNLGHLYEDALKSEHTLWQELHETSIEEGKQGLGVVLVSKKTMCRLCGHKLCVKKSRVSNVIVYHEEKGTFTGCRLPKMSSN